jgi:hypothetical protein
MRKYLLISAIILVLIGISGVFVSCASFCHTPHRIQVTLHIENRSTSLGRILPTVCRRTCRWRRVPRWQRESDSQAPCLDLMNLLQHCRAAGARVVVEEYLNRTSHSRQPGSTTASEKIGPVTSRTFILITASDYSRILRRRAVPVEDLESRVPNSCAAAHDYSELPILGRTFAPVAHSRE